MKTKNNNKEKQKEFVMTHNDDTTNARIACQEALEDIRQDEDFRAEIQNRRIQWNAKPKTTIVRIPSEVDNVLRNFAYDEDVSASSALTHFFNTVGKSLLNKLEKRHSQRDQYHDWKAYRYHIQNHKLTRQEKKVDKKVRKHFERTYVRNRPTIAA